MRTWMLLILLTSGAAVRSATLPTEGTNLALGKVAQFDPAPNYHQCRDDGDARQLFDGVYNGSAWTDTRTVDGQRAFVGRVGQSRDFDLPPRHRSYCGSAYRSKKAQSRWRSSL